MAAPASGGDAEANGLSAPEVVLSPEEGSVKIDPSTERAPEAGAVQNGAAEKMLLRSSSSERNRAVLGMDGSDTGCDADDAPYRERLPARMPA